jgi:nicotinate-nucleotide adenylyltransferase
MSDEREDIPRDEASGATEEREAPGPGDLARDDQHMATTQSVLSHDLLDEIRDALPPLPGGGRVGLLGGSFNPPHLGHVMLAYAVLATEPLDALWVLPAASHPFGKDETEYEGFRARHEMCERAFAALDAPVEIVDVEQHLPHPNYTYRLLHALHAARPGIRPRLVVGSDILYEFERWTEPEQILELCQILVVPRAGYPGTPGEMGWPRMQMRLAFEIPEISSTEIRERLADDEPVDGLVARRVLEIIERDDLYRGR